MSVRKVRDAVVITVVFLALIWALQVFNWADGYRLDVDFGILPHHVSRLPDIFLAPFLHFTWAHIEGNSVPLLVLGFLAAYRGLMKFLLLTLIVTAVSGLGVWFFQSSDEVTVGASGVIFGYFGYVLLRGLFDRNWVDIGAGVLAGALYWTILSVALPGTPGISWIGHLSGLAGGVIAAWLLRTPRSPRGPRVTGSRDPLPQGPASDGSRTGSRTGLRDGFRASDGKTRPLPESDADRLLRELEDKGL
jgi:membrane associated rhomboid family serine protease